MSKAATPASYLPANTNEKNILKKMNELFGVSNFYWFDY